MYPKKGNLNYIPQQTQKGTTLESRDDVITPGEPKPNMAVFLRDIDCFNYRVLSK